MDINSYLNKLRLMGTNVKQIDKDKDSVVYTANCKDNIFLVIIPETTKYLCENISFIIKQLYNGIKVGENIKVIGGSGLTTTYNMFGECLSEQIDLSDFNTSNVRRMHKMFSNCKANSINLRNFSTHNVEDMSQMFFNCEVDSIDLSSFNTCKVKEMYGMFQYSKIKNIDLSMFNTENVTDMSEMFLNCISKIIDIRSFTTQEDTNIKSMFKGCDARVVVKDRRLIGSGTVYKRTIITDGAAFNQANIYLKIYGG